MKKSYISPSTEMIETKLEGFMCSSPDPGEVNFDGSQEADQLGNQKRPHPIWGYMD